MARPGSYAGRVARSAGGYAALNMPANSVAPSISGLTANGSVLTCAPGTWSNTPVFAYQWKRQGLNIPGETAATYTVVAADRSTNLSCTVVATKAGTQAVVTSAPFAIPA